MSNNDGTLNRRAFLNRGTAAAGLLMGGSLARTINAYAQKTGSSSPVVETTAGKIRGYTDGNVNIFKGVPYGASTDGGGRFMPPASPKPWTGIRDTTELGPRSPQLGGGEIPEVAAMTAPGSQPMSEDCLCLNIWTSGPGGQKRPVMFWIHGGGFATGSGGAIYYDGTNLAGKQDVVVVTVNHRLNVFGFLHLTDLGNEQFSKSSNAGMLDLVAALRWVHDNITAFGGDPGNVTIMGQSGGGGKVSTLMAMPAAKGLFHRAIVQSGSALKGLSRIDATKSAEALLGKLALKPNQLDELQKLPVDRLLATMQSTQGLRLAPVVDGNSLPADPFDPVAPAISADVPLMIGSVATEITFLASTPLDPIDDETLHTQVKQYTRVDDPKADELIAVYRKAQPRASNLELYHALASDHWVRANVLTEAERKAALGKAPAYLYYFDMTTPVREGKLRTPHTLDIPYVLDNLDRARALTGGEDPHQIAPRISRAWVTFARNGDPNHDAFPRWPIYTPGRRATMILGHDIRIVNDPFREERIAMTALKLAQGGN